MHCSVTVTFSVTQVSFLTSQSNISRLLLLPRTNVLHHFHDAVFDKLTLRKRFAMFTNKYGHFVKVKVKVKVKLSCASLPPRR